MLHAVVYNLCLLLIIGNCAKKKQGVSCANPDPNTGACLRHETSVADPNDTADIMQRALKSQEALDSELRRLRAEKATLEAEIASGTRPASDQSQADAVGETIIELIENAGDLSLSPEPQVDTSEVPAVTLSLKNVKHTGVRPTFSFTHVTYVSAITFAYGGEDANSLVFKYDRYIDDKIQLDVKIPIALRFKFGGNDYCASHELSKNFESGSQPMTVSGC